MHENVRLLMEETGCERGEAELALELAQNDLEKAIRTIESLLKHIYALKAKFYFINKNYYGLLLIVNNIKTHEILRLISVISYNPALYENSVDMDWYAFEKIIFSYRLDEGSIPEFTREIEQKICNYLKSQQDILGMPDINRFYEILSDIFKPEPIQSLISIEELNLAQFRQVPKNNYVNESRAEIRDREPGFIFLQVELIEDPNGKEVSKLKEGDVIFSRITDTRDIAHYLAHLIGTKLEDKDNPLPAVIQRVGVHGSESEIQINYAPGIIGVACIKNNIKVKTFEVKVQSWWKKIIPWT